MVERGQARPFERLGTRRACKADSVDRVEAVVREILSMCDTNISVITTPSGFEGQAFAVLAEVAAAAIPAEFSSSRKSENIKVR